MDEAPNIPVAVPDNAVTDPPTQVRRPWRATARTIFAALVGFAAIAPGMYAAATSQDPAQATGWMGIGLAISGAITRVMAMSSVNEFFKNFVPFLAPEPRPDNFTRARRRR